MPKPFRNLFFVFGTGSAAAVTPAGSRFYFYIFEPTIKVKKSIKYVP
jgi:hypothetical protein